MPRQKKILEMFLKQGERAVYNVFVVSCPKIRCMTPESNCSSCEFRVRMVACEIVKRPMPESFCDRCFREDPRQRQCRYAKWRRKRIEEDKVNWVDACAYPRVLETGQLAIPSGQLIQEMASVCMKPEKAPEPFALTPNLKMNPVTRATELVGVGEDDDPNDGAD